MHRKMMFVSALSVSAVLLFSPAFMSGRTTAHPAIVNPVTGEKGNNKDNKDEKVSSLLTMESGIVYDSLRLADFGLKEKAFQLAWKGFLALLEKGAVTNTTYLSIADFSQSSNNKRLYIIDLQEMKLFMNTYVAHGRNSGAEFANSFSNTPQSHKSSLGFYVTDETYYGQHGLSLKIRGLERGINDRALARRIVIHGSTYVGEKFLINNPFTGRSFGCPAIPARETETIINTIKEGTCLFIYHPTKLYTSRSKILNG